MSKAPWTRLGRSAPLWIFAVVFLAIFAVFLFWAEPLFLGRAGVKAHLMKRAARLGPAPPGEAAVAISRMVKSFLDASKHASQVEVRIDEASSGRIAYTLILPWSEKSVKLHRRRGGTTARLTAALLKNAGADRVVVVVNVRRKKINSGESEPAGRARIEPEAGKFEWTPPEGR